MEKQRKKSTARRKSPRTKQTSLSRQTRQTSPAQRSKKLSRSRPVPEYIHTHRRGRSISRSASVVAGIFFVFVLIYLVRSLYAFLMTPHIPTEVIKSGSIDLPRSVSGIIIRDEYVSAAGRQGRVTFSVNDYDRVKPGMTVCSIQNMEAVEDINKSMASIEEQILELQQMRKDISTVDPAVQRLNAQIKNIVDSRLPLFTTRNIAEMYALKDSVTQSINSRNQMILDENKNIREDLNVQQQQLLNRLSTHVSVIRADRSGIVSPVVDGLEQTLTFENRKELSREQTQMKVDYDKIIPKKDVQAEDIVFKIIASNDWYIAVYIENDLIEGYEEGDTRTLYLENKDEYIPVTVYVERIDQGYRESFVLFKCTKHIIEFLNMRNVNLKTTDSVRKGYKISNTAIATRTFLMIPTEYVYQSDKSYVMKQTEEGEVIVPVVIADTDDSFVYVLDNVENLALSDTLVRSSSATVYTLSETLTVQGVYKVNNGFAEFKKITLDTEISQTSGYTILNPSLNQGIKAYDYIVTDAAGIEDGQIIY